MNLCEWQLNRLATVHNQRMNYGTGRGDVTIITYHFCNEDEYDRAFKRIECAIRETWLHCGMMKTVIVTNRTSDYILEFARKFSSVDIQIEKSLIPGKIFTLSADMNGCLFKRFDTPYCLIIQNDGFPLRPGIDEFVGKFDFIGAPYIRNIWWKQLIARILNYHVQNGGFSLRTRRMCENVAWYWNTKYVKLGDFPDSPEDLFYTKFLPLKECNYRKEFKFATYRESIVFSYDALVPVELPTKLPFGFHGEKSFEILIDKFK